MTTKLRIKIGPVEVEYEGTDEFLKKELPDLLKAVVELHSKTSHNENDEEPAADKPKGAARPSAPKTLSTSTVAASISAKSGSDSALAAAATLIVGEGHESVSRAQLLTAMQSAKAYYKGTYSNNLSAYLATLVRTHALLDHGNDHFGLHDTKRKDLEKKVAGS